MRVEFSSDQLYALPESASGREPLSEVSVYHFTSELSGGAGVAAQRLHGALSHCNVRSKLFYGAGGSPEKECLPAYRNQTFFWRNVGALAISRRHRRNVPGGLLTSPGWIRKTPIQALGDLPGIVNLHWVSRWLDLPSFFNSLPAGLPVVWSLHDLNPATGGCHHTGECDHFTKHCGYCPLLKSPGARDDAFRYFQIKSKCYERSNLHFVGNSEWTTAQARRSALARHVRSFRTIPLGVNIEQFRPVERHCARQALGIAEERFVAGFACADFNDPNKGGAILIDALRAVANQKPVTLLAFGSGKLPPVGDGIEVVELGVLTSPRVQSLFYSAADVFVVPSRVESFGLTALEAMACATPVLAFRTGGLPDLITDGETGLLENEIGSRDGLKNKLLWFLNHPRERSEMGCRGRLRVGKHFTDTLMARRYESLYAELC